MNHPQKKALKAAELQRKIMDELAKYPDCANITSVVVASDPHSNWKVSATARNSQIMSNLGKVEEIAAELRREYDLAAG